MLLCSGTISRQKASVVNSSIELDRVVRLVKAYPHVAVQIEPDIRRFLLTRFPYSLIYGIDDDTIVVIAVAHQHRKPRYWADRVDSIEGE